MDRGAWQSTVHEVAKSWTRLKQLSTHAHFKSVYSAFFDNIIIAHLIDYSIVSAAATAKSLQSCPTLCDPRDGSPPGSPIPGIL